MTSLTKTGNRQLHRKTPSPEREKQAVAQASAQASARLEPSKPPAARNAGKDSFDPKLATKAPVDLNPTPEPIRPPVTVAGNLAGAAGGLGAQANTTDPASLLGTGPGPVLPQAQKWLGDKVQQAIDYGKSWVDYAKEVRDVADVSKQVDTLQPGDKVTLGTGVSVDVAAAKVNGKGQLEVSCEKDENAKEGKAYVISVDSELMAGVGKQLPGKFAKVGAMVGGGGKLEFRFTDPTEAKKALETLKKMATPKLPDENNPVLAGGMTSSASPQEVQDLFKNLSAVELRGSSAVDIAAAYSKGPLSAEVGGKFSSSPTVRLEFPQGKPPQLVLKSGGQFEGRAGLTLEASKSRPNGKLDEDGKPDEDSLGLKLNGGGKVTAKVEEEHKFPLPTDLSPEKLMEDPKGTLLGVRDQVINKAESKITVSLERQGTIAGSGASKVTEISISGNTRKLAESGALIRLKAGDVEGGLQKGGTDVSVEEKTTTYKQTGLSLTPGVNIGVASAEVELECSRRSVVETQTEKPKNGTEKANEIAEARRRLNERLPQPGPVPVL